MNCRNVLVIDDDAAIRETIGDILEDDGYHPILASDGAEGIACLQSDENRPCVILLDMMMPGTNGWQFLDIQRQDPELSKIPVVVCSAFTESGKSVGPDAFLPKPVELKTLVRTIRSFCH